DGPGELTRDCGRKHLKRRKEAHRSQAMNRKMYSVAAVMMGMMTAMSHAGQASTSAHASNIGGSRGGTAGATANYNGAPGGVALTRTDSHSGKVNHAQGLAIG